MKLASLVLTPRLSALNWFSIEVFTLIAIAFLPFSKSTAHVSIVIAVVLWLFRKIIYGEKFPSIPPCNLAYALLLAIILFSLTRVPGENLENSLLAFLKWVQNIATFFMCIELFQEPKRIARFVGVFIFSMTLVALNGFWQMANGTDLLGHSIDIPGRFFRMRSSFRAPPILASFFLVAMPLMFFLWFREKKWSLKSSSLAFLLALFGVAFLATLSRAALVGFFLSVILHVFFTRKKWASLLVLAAPLPLLLPKSLRYNFFGSLNLKDITVGQRLGFWQAAFEMIREHPFLGQGIQTYRVKLPDFAPPSVLGIDLDAHNCYLQLWSEIGLWGLLAFLIPFAYFLGKEAARGLQADFPLKHALWIGITAFLIQSLFDNNFYNFQLSVLFWSFWGMYAALVK